MASGDLTQSLSKSLDRHLVFPLLEFLMNKELYKESDIQKAKIALLANTNMVDYAMDIYESLYGQGSAPQSMTEQREQVLEKLTTLQANAETIVNFLSDGEKVQQLRQDKTYNQQLLQREFDIGSEQIDALYHYAKFQFECGNYSTASEFLYHYRTLSTDPERNMSALWGKLAATILQQDWEGALEELNKLKDAIDSNTFVPVLEQLQQRSWLMHWGLYIFFNHENGRNLIIDYLFQDRYLNAVQTTSQHLLRYLAAAVVVNKRRRNVMKDLVKVLQQEEYTYQDAVTKFLTCLYVDYDFEGAQQQLQECETVLDNDFFLTALREEFVENARLLIFETYCRIHQCIDLGMLADKLNMERSEAETWVVNLIRNARLNAKIDSQAGTVVMGTSFPTPYEAVVDKTRGLSQRTFMLANAVVGSASAPSGPPS
mmetsp:Transcript_624/g.1823  ORF Transcript_624/g.1823 Transcript_624/m.1823 type:complete len:429 (+) Transcript_624:133-1419(+)|eukprot:CAMPEP_0206148566 /NCGR_PEP_ID=MMETSP1473-20131121/36991_1 /ASSEMBLY_ACC=CAM_ASM_001109 /TAXON_ID=1461547 /ORGANISM="Stichococcus sp, Strain RCC1054" /LENGTH=428 /DNA_ID=CAMNT_0053545945 /DNA_START=31 /DNA_END=1317 /DNA_ORIENTATION=-